MSSLKREEILSMVGKVAGAKDYLHQTVDSMFGAFDNVLKDWSNRLPLEPGTVEDKTPPKFLDVRGTQTSTSLDLAWQTDEDTVCEVYLDGNEAVTTEPGQTHSTVIDGLSADTSYLIQIKAFDLAGNVTAWEGMFHTLPMPLPGTPSTAQVVRHDVTWTLAAPQTAETFANGDPVLAGSVDVVGISPICTLTPGASNNHPGVQAEFAKIDLVKHGSVINPMPSSWPRQGWDNRILSDYAWGGPKQFFGNVALGVNLSKPLRLNPGTSLVSAVSCDSVVGDRTVLKGASVLTVLDKLPPAGSFRPAYAGADKTVRYNKSQMNLSGLQSLAPPAGAPTIAQALRSIERLRLDCGLDWTGERCHPLDNMKAYDNEHCAETNDAALVLHLNYPLAEKEALAIALVQLGIDCYGVLKNGGEKAWPGNGGVGQGRLWPIVFAGLVLGDDDMKFVTQRLINGIKPWFSETNQTFYVPQSYVGTRGYTQSHVGLAEWGKRHTTNPAEDNASIGAGYRQCCTANAWYGTVLSARMMAGAREAINHPALFDYQDRYRVEMKKLYPDTDYRVARSRFALAMWDTYRSKF